MIKNNKGFMLIEVIVTSTIVVTSMIALYASFNKLYNSYRTKSSYYNIDAVYATKEIINAMISTEVIGQNMNKFINNTFFNNTNGYIIANNKCNSNTNEYDEVLYNVPEYTCKSVQELYNIINMIISEYDKESLLQLKENGNLNQTFNDYIDYVITYYGITKNEEYNYIILTEMQTGDNNYYYANLRMR